MRPLAASLLASALLLTACGGTTGDPSLSGLFSSPPAPPPARKDTVPTADWYTARAQIASSICAVTAPAFAEFPVSVAAAGMVRSDTGLYNNGESEIVASLATREIGCSCRVSYRAPDTSQAIETLHSRLASDLGEAYSADDDRKDSGRIQTPDGGAVTHLISYPHDGTRWLALVVRGPHECPSGLPSEEE